MPENKNQAGKIISGNVKKPDYYTTTGKKIGDFLLGFSGIVILPLILAFVSGVAYSLFPQATLHLAWLNFIISAISLAALILLPVLFFKIGRRFVAIGIISIALIPILIFGSCLLVLGGTGVLGGLSG